MARDNEEKRRDDWDEEEGPDIDDDIEAYDDVVNVNCDLCGDEYESWEVGRCDGCDWTMCDGCTGENGCCIECNRTDELNARDDD